MLSQNCPFESLNEKITHHNVVLKDPIMQAGAANLSAELFCMIMKVRTKKFNIEITFFASFFVDPPVLFFNYSFVNGKR